MNRMILLAGAAFLLAFLSNCTSSEVYSELYESPIRGRDTVDIDVLANTAGLDTSMYDVVGVVPLQLPQKYKVMDVDKFVEKDGRIYVMDKQFNRTVFVFDSNGYWLHSLGSRGHAKDEYVSPPTNFTVLDDKSVIVYESESQKLIKTDSCGEYVWHKRFQGVLPRDLLVSSGENYVCAFSFLEDGCTNNLSLYDRDLHFVKPYLAMRLDNKGVECRRRMYQCGEDICYWPLFSDSIIVLRDEEVDKVVKINFHNGNSDKSFLPWEIKEKALSEGSYDEVNRYDGIKWIDAFEMTDSLIHVAYVDDVHVTHYVKNLSTGKEYNSRSHFYQGAFPTSDFCISGNTLVYVFDEDMMAELDWCRKSSSWDTILSHTHPKLLPVINGEVPFPVVVKIRLR